MASAETRRRRTPGLALLLLLLLPAAALANPYTVSVSPSKAEYAPGETVTISVTITPAATVIIGWEVYDPANTRKDFGQVTCSGGSCSFSFRTGADWPTGTYTVIVAVSGTADKGSATFTLKAPVAPPPPPPPPINYEPLARSQIRSCEEALSSLNATIQALQSVLALINQTISPDYLKQLSQIAGQIQAAKDLYSQQKYEQAYNTASAASTALSTLSSNLAQEVIRILRSTANFLYARTTDPVVRELLEDTIATLSALSPYEAGVFDRLMFIARTLAVVAKTLDIPALQASLSLLSEQLQDLQSKLATLNQTRAQLEQQVAALQQQNQSLQQQVSSLQAQVDSLRGQISQLEQQVSSLQAENSNLKAQLEQMMPTNTAIAAAVMALVAGLALGVVVSRLLRKP